MQEGSRKKYPPEQMNIRLGEKFIAEFNEYMEKHGGKKIDFIRDAIKYWMSVDGTDDTKLKIENLEEKLSLYKELLTENQKHYEQRINDLNRIIDEKDERIKILMQTIKK